MTQVVRQIAMRKSRKSVIVQLLVLCLTSLATSAMCLAQGPSDSALLPESWARKSAFNANWPIYPVEAFRHGIAGVVRIRFKTDPAGNVTMIKVQPGTDSVLRKAVIDAVKQWKFKPSIGVDRLEVPVFSRLAFQFSIRNAEPQIEWYDPRPRPPICLACTNSSKEMIEWDDWEVAWSKSEPAAAPKPLP